MLDHDEQLPEEQANPGLIRELRTTYQMKTEEQQVLSRVHERLAQSPHPLSLLEPTREGAHERARRPVFSKPPSYRPISSRRSWLPRFSMFAAVIFVVLLVGALALTFTTINQTRVGSPGVMGGVTNSIRILLVPADKSHQPSHASMEATSRILSQRFTKFGLRGSTVSVGTTNGQPSILVELPDFGGNSLQIINILLQTGNLAFWDTGQQSLPINTTFVPAQFTLFNPGGKPHFTGTDLNPLYIRAMTDPQTGQPEISAEMKGDAINRFKMFTARSIGDYLTLTLDGKVLSSPVIQSSISGPFAIAGVFTQQQVKAIVSVLKYGPLPVALKKMG